MKVTELALPEVKIIETAIFSDNRGYSEETYTKHIFEYVGITYNFVVDYVAYNAKKHTLRGIHIQNKPKAQTKLVRVLRGSILDVVVDLRKDSPTFKKWVSVILSQENHRQILIPIGFGHAFLTLKDNTSVLYKFDDYYVDNMALTIRWDDPEINIDWGNVSPILSAKDREAACLKDTDIEFCMGDTI